MKVQFSRLKNVVSVLALGVVVATSSAATVTAAPAQSSQPPRSTVSGPQAKPPVEAGKVDAKQTEKLGSTNEVKTNALGASPSVAALPFAGSVSGVDFSTFYNYCYNNLVYTTVYNSTTALKYIHVQIYNNGGYRDVYTSVPAGGSYTYPAFYHTVGSYSAYLYVWNGSSYVYDEYKGGTNTCNVSVTRTYNTGGWVQLKIQNFGTAYASQYSSELAPNAAYGTYTGLNHYDSPTPGGAAIYRWFQVDTRPYGIVSNTSGSYLDPALFVGDL